MTHSDNHTRPGLDADTEPDSAELIALDHDRARPATGPPGTPDAAADDAEGDSGPAASDGDGDGRVLVDSPQAQQPPRLTPARVRASQRQPIIPPWLRSRSELRAATGWLAGHLAHTAAYHATRSPKYATRLTIRAPRGAARLLTSTLRWTLDAEGAPARQAALRREDTEQYLRLSRQRDTRVRLRTTITLTAATLVLLVLLVVLLVAPWWARWAATAGLLVLLGVLGAPADRPLLDTAVVTPRVTRLTSEVVVRALSVLGLAGITQALARNPGRSRSPPRSPATAPAGAPTSTYHPGSLPRRSSTAATSSPPGWAAPSAACGQKATTKSARGGWCCGSATRTWPPPDRPPGRCCAQAPSTCSPRSRSAPTHAAAPSRWSWPTATC